MWLVLRWITGNNNSTLLKAVLLTLVAFVIFIPWRIALEAASLEGLEVAICPKTDSSSQPSPQPVDAFTGIFIGENDTTVYIGEEETETKSPLIAEYPRDQIKRLVLGKDAKNIDCSSIP